MAKKASGTDKFEVSFVDANGNRRVAQAHDEDQAKQLKRGFESERELRLNLDPSFKGLEDVQVHKISTIREQVALG